MSKRDQTLIDLVSLPLSTIAETIGKSPQALRKGIKLDRHYFSHMDVAKIITFFADHEPKLAGLLRERISREYPEFPDLLNLVPDEDGPPASDSFDKDRHSVYWVVSPDFGLFLVAAEARTSEENQSLSFSQMLATTESTVVFFITPADEKDCRDYIRRAGLTLGQGAEIYLHRGSMQFMPTLVVQTRHNGSVTLLFATEAGFETPSRTPLDAGRLRAELLRMKYATSES